MTDFRTPESQADEAVRRARMAGRAVAQVPPSDSGAARLAEHLEELQRIGSQLLPDDRIADDVAITVTQLSGPDAGRVAGVFELPDELVLRVIRALTSQTALLSTEVHCLTRGLYDDGRATPVTGLAQDAVDRRIGRTERPALHLVTAD
ncbi:hypothetical protein [Streptomyces sp. NPDC059788]|uniref:hypothetical protein n=1 Tax=Streptomyces sp. NPDC059788 TaxID=3346948 RepID=UPI00365AE2E7